MKIMSRDFTVREKILLLVLAILILVAGYYLAVDQPVRTSIQEAKYQQEELNVELQLLQAKAAKYMKMQNELNAVGSLGVVGVMGSYNNAKAELNELNQILADAISYDISFEDVTRDGNLIRRGFHLTFTAESYGKAAYMLRSLCSGEWRCLVSDVRFVSDGDHLAEGNVNVGVTASFYETMEGGIADSGLPEA